MYLMGIKDGKIPCGNAGTRITRYMARYKIMDFAMQFKQVYNHDEIYLIRNYPQKACELSPNDFVDWVKSTGEQLL